MDLFDIPLCGKKLWYMYFLLYFLGNKMLHKRASEAPILAHVTPLFINFFHFAIRFNHY